MEWFSQKTDVGGIQIPNWGIRSGCRHCSLARLLTHALSRKPASISRRTNSAMTGKRDKPSGTFAAFLISPCDLQLSSGLLYDRRALGEC